MIKEDPKLSKLGGRLKTIEGKVQGHGKRHVSRRVGTYQVTNFSTPCPFQGEKMKKGISCYELLEQRGQVSKDSRIMPLARLAS